MLLTAREKADRAEEAWLRGAGFLLSGVSTPYWRSTR